jgi:hypothetical protein
VVNGADAARGASEFLDASYFLCLAAEPAAARAPRTNSVVSDSPGLLGPDETNGDVTFRVIGAIRVEDRDVEGKRLTRNFISRAFPKP